MPNARSLSKTHPLIQHNYRHGMTHTKVHDVWRSMLQRCNDPKHKAYHNYGGRGIKVCERWLEFENFYADMGEPNGLTLDRIDNAGNYEPGNCRWISYLEQGRNKRTNKIVQINGESGCISYFAEKYGINKTVLARRLRNGEPFEMLIRRTEKRISFIQRTRKPASKLQKCLELGLRTCKRCDKDHVFLFKRTQAKAGHIYWNGDREWHGALCPECTAKRK